MMQPQSKNQDGFELDLSSEFVEPMLKESLDRFVLFPIEHSEIWEMYKQACCLILDCRGNRPSGRC